MERRPQPTFSPGALADYMFLVYLNNTVLDSGGERLPVVGRELLILEQAAHPLKVEATSFAAQRALSHARGGRPFLSRLAKEDNRAQQLMCLLLRRADEEMQLFPVLRRHAARAPGSTRGCCASGFDRTGCRVNEGGPERHFPAVTAEKTALYLRVC